MQKDGSSEQEKKLFTVEATTQTLQQEKEKTQLANK